MKVSVYAVRDMKSEMFLQPFVAHNDATASRNFVEMVRRKDQFIYGTYPEDFSVWRVGSFDDSTGALSAETPHLVVTGVAVVHALNNPPPVVAGG